MAMEDSIILSLPLEIRQNIYEWASERPTGARLILKEYFEKIDTTIPRLPPVVVAATNNPIAATPNNNGTIGVEDDEDMQGQEDDEGESAAADAGSDVEENDEDEEEQGEEEDEEEDDDAANWGAAPRPTSTQHSYGRTTKYRHILPIIQLSHCPPPKGLLMTCKQINEEASSLHRKRTVLTIDVNKGFEHFSFFLETMKQMIDTPYSPLEQIHKVNLVITWDSEWLREKSTPPDNQLQEGQMFFFGFFLEERLQVMLTLLEACPELEKVTIDYHDTEDTARSREFMLSKLMDLQVAVVSRTWVDAQGNELPVEVELHEHFSAAGTTHARDSLLALRRTEFDRFLSGGLGML